MTTHKNIYAALCVAQTEMGQVVKGSVNPHFKSKYADLADVMQVAIPALTNNGIAIWHSVITENDMHFMRTTLSHGETDTHIHCDVPLIVDKNNMQGMKSATTYAKRIGVESLAGIAPEDDDGNAAAKAAPSKINTETLNQIASLVGETGADPEKLCKYFKVDNLMTLTQDQGNQAVEMLKKKLEA